MIEKDDPHQKILEQLNKGAQPAATSSKHQQNAFHKQATSSESRRRITDALIKHTPSDQLREAAIARDRDGKTPIELAHEGLGKAMSNLDDVQRERLTHFVSELMKAAAPPIQDSNEPHKDGEIKEG
jgi:SRSO17 transposase